MTKPSRSLTPAHKRLIELVARRAYESLRARNQVSANAASLAPEPAPQVASGAQQQLRGISRR
jgi:hypothetical protein